MPIAAINVEVVWSGKKIFSINGMFFAKLTPCTDEEVFLFEN